VIRVRVVGWMFRLVVEDVWNFFKDLYRDARREAKRIKKRNARREAEARNLRCL